MPITNVHLTYNAKDPLNGAFTYLQKAYNKIDISDGIIKISARGSTSQNMNYPIVNRDLGSGYWRSSEGNGSWYKVKFLKNNFFLESYFVRAWQYDFFSNWTVLGSNDGIKYDVVDELINFKVPSSWNNHFVCKYPKARRMFKIVTNGKDFNNFYRFHIYRLEFFGKFVDPIINSVNNYHFQHRLLILLLIFICCYK